MASYQQDRDEFLPLMGAEGVPVSVARKLLSAASTLQKLAELECSSERADRDHVRCPGDKKHADNCLCQDYGSAEFEESAECKGSDGRWSPMLKAHGTVPRYMVQEANTRRRVEVLCAQYSLKPR